MIAFAALILPSVLGTGWAVALPATIAAATSRPKSRFFTLRTLTGMGTGARTAGAGVGTGLRRRGRRLPQTLDFTPLRAFWKSRAPAAAGGGSAHACVLNSAAPATTGFPSPMAAFRALSAFVVASLLAGAAAAASPTLDRIKANGFVTFGYRDAAAPFSVRQRNGAPRGYSVELCEKVAGAIGKAVGLPGLKVVWRAGRQRNAHLGRREPQDRRRVRDDDDHAVAHGTRRLQPADLRRRRQRAGARGQRARHGGGPQGQADRRDAGNDDGSRAEAHARVDRRQRVARAGQGRRGRPGRAPVRQGRRLRVGPDAADAARGTATRAAPNSRSCRTISRSSRTRWCCRATTRTSGFS